MRPVPTRFVALGILAALLPLAALAESMPSGNYECWFYSTPHPLQNFTLKGDIYVDASGKSGSVAISGGEVISAAAISTAEPAYSGAAIRQPSALSMRTAR